MNQQTRWRWRAILLRFSLWSLPSFNSRYLTQTIIRWWKDKKVIALDTVNDNIHKRLNLLLEIHLFLGGARERKKKMGTHTASTYWTSWRSVCDFWSENQRLDLCDLACRREITKCEPYSGAAAPDHFSLLGLIRMNQSAPPHKHAFKYAMLSFYPKRRAWVLRCLHWFQKKIW